MGHFYHVGQSHCGRFLQWKSENASFLHSLIFFRFIETKKFRKKRFFQNFEFRKKRFFEIFSISKNRKKIKECKKIAFSDFYCKKWLCPTWWKCPISLEASVVLCKSINSWKKKIVWPNWGVELATPRVTKKPSNHSPTEAHMSEE